MLKLAGALLLLCGCFGVGLLQVKNMNKRVRTIRSLLCALEVMERELSFRVPLLEEMLLTAENSAEEPIRSFLSVCRENLEHKMDLPFAIIWNDAARTKLYFLKKQDLEPIFELGGVLGRYDCQKQSQAIRQTCVILENVLLDAASEQKDRGRMYKVLGTSIGALLVILLL